MIARPRRAPRSFINRQRCSFRFQLSTLNFQLSCLKPTASFLHATSLKVKKFLSVIWRQETPRKRELIAAFAFS